MREHEVNKLDNFIMGWYGGHEFCDKLIDYWKNDKSKKSGFISQNGQEDVVNKKVKDSIDSRLLLDNPILQEYINEYLREPTDLYIDRYFTCNRGGPWTVTQGSSIQYYRPGGAFYQWHCERNSEQPHSTVTRHLVFMTYLNDVTDGGETEFYHQKVKIKPEKGLTLIWPADWTFTHRGVPSPTQEKYIITGWYNYCTPEE